MTNYHQLSDRIAARKYSMVKTLLSEDKSLDITYENGRFFKISIKDNSYDIVKALLNYFEEKQLSRYDINSEKYNELRAQLKNILEDVIEEKDLSLKMQEVLSPYINFEDSVDSREYDFDDIDFNVPISFENDQDHEIMTSGNVIDHNHNTEIIS